MAVILFLTSFVKLDIFEDKSSNLSVNLIFSSIIPKHFLIASVNNRIPLPEETKSNIIILL